MKRYLLNILICLLLVLWGPEAFAQQSLISGIIQDDSGLSVEGAKITLIENPSTQTETDEDGTFSIRAEVGQNLLVLKGSQSNRIAITEDELQIVLGSKKNEVPLGYGLSLDSDELTAAVGYTRMDQSMVNSSVINPENTLYGKIPGLTVLQNGGPPPTSPNLFIRGQETFGNSNILVLVDGFERPLSSLSLEEIESITVLKDAASLALYGQRGANGVLLATTKRGNSGGLKVRASYQQSITEATRLPDFLEAPEYARALNEARENDGLSVLYSETDLKAFDSGTSPYFYPNVNWFDETLGKHGSRSNFDITLEGGGDNARYFAVMNYSDDDGIFGPVNQNEDYSTQKEYGRFNFRSNIDVNLSRNLLFKLNVGGNIVDINQPQSGSGVNNIFNALYSVPSAAFPVKTPDDNWGGTQTYDNNPVAILTSTGYGNPNERNFFVDGALQQDLDALANGLSAELALSYNSFADYWQRKEKQYSYEDINPVRDSEGNIVDTTSTVYGEDTDLDFIERFGTQRRQSNILGKLNYTKVFENSEVEVNMLYHQDALVLRGRDNTFHRRNFAGNIQYGLAGKYYFNAAASYSGNNLLPGNNRYGLLPAVSAAWLLSGEDFLQDVSFLSHLKLRASWGMSGNDRLPSNNPHVQTYNSSASGYWFRNSNDYQGGFAESRLATSDFTFETSYKTNVGIDARLFNKLDFTADLFFARRTNILTGTNGNVSNVIGVGNPLEADGIVENKGIEASMDWQDNIGEFAYHIGGQFSFARNEIVESHETYRPHEYMRRTGRPVGQQFGLEAIGFFEDEDDIANSPQQVFSDVRPGDIKYKDQNGDGIVNEFDEIAIGHATNYPEIYFSASLGFDYKGFSLSTLFQGTGNHTAYLNTKSVYWPLRDNNTISSYYFNNRWTPETSGSATFPRLTTEDNDNNFRRNDLWLVDRSYIKLRTLEVSYSLPASVVTGRWNMDEIRLFMRGKDLFSFDNINELDPERLGVGYPTLRSYNLGLEIAF